MGCKSHSEIDRRGRYRAVACSGVPQCLVARLMDDPTFPLSESSTRLIKDGDTTRVVRTVWTIDGRTTPAAYKCVRRLTWLKRLTQVLGVNRTWRTYRAGERLEALGIPTARALLVLLPPRWSPSRPTWIAHEWLDGAQPIGVQVRALGRTDNERRLGKLARELGNTLGRLHRAGGTHRDLKPENILARPATDDAPPGHWLIDLDGLTFRREVGRRRRWRDLSRLAVGIEESGGLYWTTRLRFLRGYREGLDRPGDWKTDWRSLRRATERRIAKRARRR